MLGNVMEWTMDHYDEKTLAKMSVNVSDPAVAFDPEPHPKVLKGGGFSDEAQDLRSASKIASDPEWNRRDPQIPKSKWWLTDALSVGFRIIRPLKQPETNEVQQFFKLYLAQ
jgi:formylglycine-generating enzyme required for sulfatase activity